MQGSLIIDVQAGWLNPGELQNKELILNSDVHFFNSWL